MSCISIHQPAFLPWLGYFDKIKRSDIFVFLDSVQYEKNSFINRNKIKTPNGPIWLTVPVKKHGLEQKIQNVKVDSNQNWKKKHLNSVYMNYKKAQRFEECYTKLESLYKEEYESLGDLCYFHLLFWLKEIGIDTKIVRSKELNIDSRKSDLILNICEYFNANKYISGINGLNYLKKEDFNKASISIEFQNYSHPTYPQLWGDFLPKMSILDFWMNSEQYHLI
ncbi:WbqC family protein [Cytobacillus firmus]|uniref:WbqC family protein n=1 Tax=Cytobacillus firmus TaxID=1399 RepID=UPI0018CFCB26|nr:WbqC family protein [Cytobacillus firmus]MBG9588630.1 hypothetical protein [Cytobacillus firmus]